MKDELIELIATASDDAAAEARHHEEYTGDHHTYIADAFTHFAAALRASKENRSHE